MKIVSGKSRLTSILVVGGMRADSDNRVRGTFHHNPSSLRLSMADPNLQQIPRGTDSEVERYVKEMFVAPQGSVFWARDYSGIEAKLVGYFVGSARYTRLAALGVHAFLASHILHRPADLSWSDSDLLLHFKEIKRDKGIYDRAKRTVHASNYMVSPNKLVIEYPEIFPTIKDAAALQGLYFDIFPEIRGWHKDLCQRVDGTKRRHLGEEPETVDPWTLGVCHAVNPFGYTHRFYNVLDWELVEYEGKKEWISSYGEDAKRLISFLPQSTAAAIIKRAAKGIWYSGSRVRETLRLLIHDEIFGECVENEVGDALVLSKQIMEAPIPELPLDPSWGMGTHLMVGTEAKVGKSWATMDKVDD